jgi:ApaG protein
MEQNVAITEGVLVRVVTQFRADVSQVADQSFFFHYRVEIENQNPFPVQLIHRDWFIFDSLNPPVHVSGEGVVGQQPTLEPGETYQYTSGCELHSEVGAMHGFYTFINPMSQTVFRVNIPAFQLIFPGRLN